MHKRNLIMTMDREESEMVGKLPMQVRTEITSAESNLLFISPNNTEKVHFDFCWGYR